MDAVTFELVEGLNGFLLGDQVEMKAGEKFQTSDPVLIAELDQASHAVRRVVKGASAKDKEE